MEVPVERPKKRRKRKWDIPAGAQPNEGNSGKNGAIDTTSSNAPKESDGKSLNTIEGEKEEKKVAPTNLSLEEAKKLALEKLKQVNAQYAAEQGIPVPPSTIDELKEQTQKEPTPADQPIEADSTKNKENQPKYFVGEIPINDSSARFRLCEPSFLTELVAGTQVTATKAGMYVEPGGMLPLGVKKLHLKLQSEDREELEKIVIKVQNILEAAGKEDTLDVEAKKTKINVCVPSTHPFGIIGRVLGVKGAYIRHIQQQSGAMVRLRGKGSRETEMLAPDHPARQEPLHFYIESSSQASLEKAISLTKDLLTHVHKDYAAKYGSLPEGSHLDPATITPATAPPPPPPPSLMHYNQPPPTFVSATPSHVPPKKPTKPFNMKEAAAAALAAAAAIGVVVDDTKMNENPSSSPHSNASQEKNEKNPVGPQLPRTKKAYLDATASLPEVDDVVASAAADALAAVQAKKEVTPSNSNDATANPASTAGTASYASTATPTIPFWAANPGVYPGMPGQPMMGASYMGAPGMHGYGYPPGQMMPPGYPLPDGALSPAGASTGDGSQAPPPPPEVSPEQEDKYKAILADLGM